MKNLFISMMATIAFVAPVVVFAQSTSCVSIPSGLAVGSTGTGVTDLQRFLAAQNYSGGGSWMITGYYGQATAAAARNFQAIHGLPQTGAIDASTALVMSAGCTGAATAATFNTMIAPNSYGNTWYQSPTAYSSTYYPSWTYASTYSAYQNNPTYYPGYPGYYQNQQGYPYRYGASPVITSVSQNTGYPGQSVTIYGQYFDPNDNTVLFDGTSLTNIPSQNGASLTFTIPSAYGYTSLYQSNGTQVQLSVLNAYGTSNSISFTLYSGGYGCSGPSCYCGGYPYNYPYQNWYILSGGTNCPQPFSNDTSAPAIGYLSPNAGGVGSAVTVYGSGFTYDNNTVHFGIGIIAGLRSIDGRSVSFTVPASLSGYGTQPITLSSYPVTVTNNLGYTTSPVSFAVTSLGGNNAPVVSSVSGPNSLAIGQAGSWSVNVTSGYGQYLTFSADWGDNNTYPYAASPVQNVTQTNTLTHTYMNAGTYSIRFTVTNLFGQSNVYTTTVTVGGGGSYSSAISMYNGTFSPGAVSVPRGSTVTWTNTDAVAHTVTSSTGLFDSGALYPGQTYQYTFANPGSYAYYSSTDPHMTGSVYVF